MDSLISFLGLVNKAGRLSIGEEPVGASCRAKKASLIVLATDAADNSVRRAKHFAEAGQCLCLTIPLNKAQLGQASGRSSCAMAAIDDIGFAAALAKKLVAADADSYTEAHERLFEKAQKSLQRQKEKRAHEKKLARKQKPWAFRSQ